MSILIEKEIKVSDSTEYKFSSVLIRKHPIHDLIATVTFDVLSDSGAVINKEVLTYTGTAYNTFWDSFSTGKFLYDELVSKKSLSVQPTVEIESEFKNS